MLCLVVLGRFMPCDVGANHCRLRHWVGEVWTRSHFQAEGVSLGGFF